MWIVTPSKLYNMALGKAYNEYFGDLQQQEDFQARQKSGVITLEDCRRCESSRALGFSE